MTPRPRPGRPGFTIPEILMALAALSVAAVLAARLGTAALTERTRTDARLEATEAAANALEAARAVPWDGLTPEWAATQKLPEVAAGRLRGGALATAVGPEPGRLGVKRVTVTVRYDDGEGRPARPVELVGLFAARTLEGGKK